MNIYIYKHIYIIVPMALRYAFFPHASNSCSSDICMYVCMYVCMYLSIYLSVYLSIYLSICIYAYMYVDCAPMALRYAFLPHASNRCSNDMLASASVAAELHGEKMAIDMKKRIYVYIRLYRVPMALR